MPVSSIQGTFVPVFRDKGLECTAWILTGGGRKQAPAWDVSVCYSPGCHDGQLFFLTSAGFTECCKATKRIVFNIEVPHFTQQICKVSAFFLFDLFRQ